MENRPSAPLLRGRGRARGAVVVVFALLLVVLLGFVGMALDLGRLYNRKAELQNVADAAALAAARELNGSASGISKALAQAMSTANTFHYQYGMQNVSWSDAAISFSNQAAGPWSDAGSAANDVLFAKVDTRALGDYGTVSTFFMQALSSALATPKTYGLAVAGRSAMKVTPLAICAMSPLPAAARINTGPPVKSELVEYGFRRGVAYDLMNLNPNGSTAENFVVDPLDAPGAAGPLSNTDWSVAAPFVCAGAMPMTHIKNVTLTVRRPFPLASLFNQLNSRFGAVAACNVSSAPPDANVKAYVFGSAIGWMAAAPGGQSALSTAANPLRTIADLGPVPAPTGITPAQYGPLWAYASAVQYAATEPPAGYTAFTPADWSVLYAPNAPAANAYPATTPYGAAGAPNLQAPAAGLPKLAGRRVLNLPLLACPVAAGGGVNVTATVLAIGKFLLTVPATATSVYAEFGGLATEQALAGPVELFQ